MFLIFGYQIFKAMNYTVSDGFLYYTSLVKDKDVKTIFQSNSISKLWESITEEQANVRYAEGKWSIKQLLGHVTDHERIMTYRILRFSRKDNTELSGYDQNLLVENARFDELSYADLLADYKNVRQATVSLLKGLSEKQLQLKGKAWLFELTIEEYFKSIIGHEYHHAEVVKEIYLN